MKKVLIAVMAAGVALTMAACTSQKDAEVSPEQVSATANAPAVQPAALPSTQPAPAPSTAPASGSANTIVATAQGEITITPDVAYVSVGMSTSGSKAEQVQKSNDEAMAKILEAIRKAGVDDADIATSEYSVYPEYDYSSSRQIIRGYMAVNRASVTINDISNVGKVLEAANDAGANEIGQISFSVKDMNGAYDQALSEAIRAARTRAQVMADASGVGLGGLVNVSETGYSSPYLQRSYTQYTEQAAMDSASSSEAGISSGDLKVTAHATVVFEIE